VEIGREYAIYHGLEAMDAPEFIYGKAQDRCVQEWTGRQWFPDWKTQLVIGTLKCFWT